MIYEIYFLENLAYSVAIESIVILYLLPKDIKLIYRVGACILPTLTTLPYIWFIFPIFLGDGAFYRYFSELFAVVVEGWIIYLIANIKIKQAFFISFVANFISFFVGVIKGV